MPMCVAPLSSRLKFKSGSSARRRIITFSLVVATLCCVAAMVDIADAQIVIPSAGNIATVAGNGSYGYSGDGGQATSASLSGALGVATDSAGNIYISDYNDNVVRKVNASTGVISTIVGTGTSGFSGDGGPASAAQISSPMGLAIDSQDDLYIIDGNNYIRKVTASTGIIASVAGNGQWSYSGDGGPATSGSFAGVRGITLDSAGNLYIADTENNVIREVSAATGIITTVAGNGTGGYSGDGSAATAAELNQPGGIAVDSLGNLYISDSGNSRIRKVNASTGVITTIAGTGTAGYTGDGGAATSAEINAPYGIAVDSNSDVFIADFGANVVREVNGSTGNISTLAGNGIQGYSGDEGAATSAELNQTYGVDVDASGNAYIADWGNDVIRAVGASNAGSPKTLPSITWPTPAAINYGVALSTTQLDATASVQGTFQYSPSVGSTLSAGVHALSVLFMPTDNTHYEPAMATVPLTVNVVTPTINWSAPSPIVYGATLGATQLDATASVSGTFAYSPNVGAVLAPGSQTLSVTFTPSDTADYNSVTASVTLIVSGMPTSGFITTVAGDGSYAYNGDGGPALNAAMEDIQGIAVDSNGNIYIADTAVGVVRKVTASTGTITTIAGTGTQGYSGDGGPATSAMLNSPIGLALDGSGNLYIADSGNNRVRKLTASTRAISTIAGNGTADFFGDGGSAAQAELSNPEDVALDNAGDIFIADAGNHRIREISAFNGVITTIAGDGDGLTSGDGGPATNAGMNNPYAIAVDTAGNVYISDFADNRIREVTASTGIISTIAGNGTAGYTGDGGAASSAELHGPAGLALDSAGNVYFADLYNYVVRRVAKDTSTITTIAGNGTAGYSGDGGPATAAELYYPNGIAVDASGNVYISDCGEKVVRVVGSPSPIAVSVAPTSSALYAGQTKQFNANVSGSTNKAVSWSISPAGLGSVDATGVYTAPGIVSVQQNVVVTATSQADTTKSASATVTLLATVAVSVTPGTSTLYGGQSQQFTATVSNTTNTAVAWSISPTGVGTVGSDGLYTAPATVSSQQTVTITATSQADSTKSASATVTLSPPACTPNGYTYARSIIIDHTKVPNTDQANFPFLFSTTDPTLATTANGGHVTSPNGYDIVFSTDPAGQHLLNFEIEKYNPSTGQLIAWVNLPSLSHTTDTVLYVVYGNSTIMTSQQHPAAVWDSNFLAVYHFTGTGSAIATDSTVNGNSGTATNLTSGAGAVDGAGIFDGSTSYIQVPAAAFEPYPTGFTASFGIWFKTSSDGAILGQTNGVAPGVNPSGWVPALYIDSTGKLRASIFWHGSPSRQMVTAGSYNDGKWHFVYDTYATGTETLYVDGAPAGSQTIAEDNYSSTYSYSLGTAYTSAWAGGNGFWFYLNGGLDEAEISNTARSADWISTEFSNQSAPSSFYSLGPESTMEVTPASVILYASQSYQFGATILGSGTCTSSVTWSLPAGSPGSISSSTGVYTAPAQISAPQTVLVVATNSANSAENATGTITLWPPTFNPTLKLSASVTPPYVPGSSESFQAALTNADGTPLSGTTVSFTVAGANPGTGSATTDSDGMATYTYTGTTSGTDTIHASANAGGSNASSNSLTVNWIVPAQPISTTTVLAQFFHYNPVHPLTFDATPDMQPVFSQTFPSILFNPPSGVVPGNTSVGVSTFPFTDVITDKNGNYAGTIVAQGNGYQAGVASFAPYQAVFTGSFVVASGGDAVIPIYADNEFILGIGGGATRVSGPINSSPDLTAFEQYPIMGASPLDNPIGGFTITVHFPGPGTYPFELDYAQDGVGDESLVMMAGPPGSNGFAPGLPAAGGLTLSPGSVQAQPQGGRQSFTVVATDAAGNPVTNLSVSLVVSNDDSEELSAITDSTGTATFSYQNTDPGTDNVQAVAIIDGMVAYSSIVSVPWTQSPPSGSQTGGSGTLQISVSGQQTVVLPKTLALTGTVSDSAGGTIAVSWTQVSGPGTVTFTAPQQTSTTASFTQAGSYVLQLAASDSANSAAVQFPVTVDPEPDISQGWIASPTNGSAVCGIVPITLASGITLQSGVLSYYPANNITDVVVLNQSALSGQIGTFDTTNLPNGSYWIELQGTDASGTSEDNLALVTVCGNYKPGRVTATITDLVVPANGLAIQIQRRYDSLNANKSSDFGYGWSLGTNVDLTVDPKGDVTFTLGGLRRTFYLTPSYAFPFPWYFPAYTPEPGFHGTLTDSSEGCPLDILIPDGSLWECADGAGYYNPPGFIYTDPTGTSYTISANGNLQSIADKNGNTLTIGTNGITSSTGLHVAFLRDSQGRITQITDPQQNEYLYGYDVNGNLVSVTYPETAGSQTCAGATAPNTSQYSYYPDAEHTTYPAHYYAGGTDARCNQLPSTAYYESGDMDASGKYSVAGKLESVTDALGETTGYTYDLSTNTTTITYPPDGGGTVGHATMVYDNFGDLLTSTDPLNHTTTNVYDSSRNLTSTTDPLGNITCYTYDSKGNRTSTTLPQPGPTCSSVENTTAYNQYSEPTSTTDELGNVRTFTYDMNFNPQSVTDSLGTLASFIFNPNGTMAAGAIGFDLAQQPTMASQFSYDSNGNMISRTDALGRTTSYTYDNLGHKLSMTIPLPNSNTNAAAATTNYTYDSIGNLTQTAAPLGRTTSSQYNGNGNKLSDTDANSHVTNYQYDALNRLKETDYPDGTNEKKTYDFRSNVVDDIDQAGHDTHYEYYLDGHVESVTRAYNTPNAATTSYTYDADGRKLSETDPDSHTTSYTYDNAGNLLSVTGPKGNFQYGYDNARNRVSMTDGNNHTTQYRYDARKRLTKTTYPDQTTVTNAYDGPGNLIKVIDQANNEVDYTYDAANQLKTVVQVNSPNSGNNSNSYGYDPDGNLIGLTDENGHTTQDTYDLLYRMTGKTLPDGTSTETRQYDPVGNLTSLTHFSGTTTTFTYDKLNRLLTRMPDSSLNEATESFTYTGTGKRATMTDASGTTNYTYDNLDRLITKQTPEGTLNYTYDSAGNLASMTSSDGVVNVAYTWDNLNRLGTVTDNRLGGSSNVTTYGYDTANNLVTVTYPNTLQSTFQYDNLNRLTSMTSASNIAYGYTLGPTGNRTQVLETNGRTVNWSFDGIYRLTGETVTGDQHYNGSISYGLDPVGNRLSASSSLHGVNSGSFNYNADDEMSGELYDANGNVTSAGGKTFAYDSQNRLTSMNGTAVQIRYDGDGNRVAKTANGVTTQYLVDDLNPTGYPQVVEEIVSGAPQREYTYGLQRIDEDQVIQGAWVPSFYGYDGFGTVRQLTNVAGAVTDTYEYDAFGNSVNLAGSTPNAYLYRGEQWDTDLGLYYSRARYYNPLTGRFISRDPEDGFTTDPITLHKYLYASGDPVNHIDPSGRDDLIEIEAIEEDLSTAENKELEAAGKRVSCILQTTADVLQVVIPPEGATLLQLLPDLKNCNADAKYNKLRKCEKHHVWPRYLGGPQNGPVVPINGLYHQHITNAFRACWPYGLGKPSIPKAEQCMQQVYELWPLNAPEAQCLP